MEYHWTSRQADFFTALMNALNREGIRYFVLRNFEELPENNTGKDVDIVIEPGSYKSAKRLMLECMKQHSLHHYTITNFDRMRCWYIMDADRGMSIHIDLMENEVYHGFALFRFEELYKHVIPHKNFYVLNETWHALMLLVQNLVAYKSLKPRYQEAISAAHAHQPEALEVQILAFWGARHGARMVQHLRSADFTTLLAEAPLWSRRALRRIFLKRPFSTTKNVLRFLLGKAYQLLWCPKRTQRFIAVEAPDGTGKTTFLDALVARMGYYYAGSSERFCIHHFRPQLLPNLGAVGEKAGVMKQDTDFTKPHRAKPAGFVGSLLRMGYYWLDYVIGVPLLLRREAQYGHYLLFDRYSYDFLVDPRCSRIGLPEWLRWLFVRLTPQPGIVFVLWADTETIYRRKQELTPEEIERQLAEFAKLEKLRFAPSSLPFVASRLSYSSNKVGDEPKELGKRCVFIDATQSPQAMAEQAARVIMERFMCKVS